MKSGLKYTQSFGKCSEQDTTFSHTCSQRAVGFGVRRQQRERGYPLRAAGANRTHAAFFSSTWPIRPRYRASRSGEAFPKRAESGCPQKQQAKWYRGELQPGDRLSGLRLRVDAVCIQNEDGGFFHPLPPGRLWFLSAAARWTLAVLPFGKKGKR